MPEPRLSEPADPLATERDGDEYDTVLTSPADVESAGRSCMAILVLGAIILVLLVIWIAYRITAGGQ